MNINRQIFLADKFNYLLYANNLTYVKMFYRVDRWLYAPFLEYAGSFSEQGFIFTTITINNIIIFISSCSIIIISIIFLLLWSWWWWLWLLLLLLTHT